MTMHRSDRSRCGASRRALLWALTVVMGALPAPAAGIRHFARSKGDHAPYRLTTPHFRVEFSVSAQIGQKYAALCERAYKNFRKKFHLADGVVVWQGRCRVLLFADRSEFSHFASNVHHSPGAAESGGYTRITKKDPDIVLFLDGTNHTRLQQVLVHEMTHVFLQLYERDVPLPTWLHEGFAQYFEFRVQPGRSRLKSSKARIKRLVRGGRQAPLAKFREADFPATDLDSYAQAWSLVDFMVRKGSAKRTGDFVLALKHGATQDEALRKTFRCSLDRFEQAWKSYVRQAY